MSSKPLRYYVLSVAPDMDHIRRGVWIRSKIMDYESANTLYKSFKNIGCIVYLEIVERVHVGTRAEGDILKFWGE